MTDFILLVSKITADGDHSHEIKRCFLLGRKAMTKLDRVLKNTQRHHFADKGLYRQSCGFSSSHVHLWELDHKKRVGTKELVFFELWCWRRLLRVPWTPRRSKQSILKEINPEYSLEGLMQKLKLQCFGHLSLTHWKTSWYCERQKAKGEKGSRGWDL